MSEPKYGTMNKKVVFYDSDKRFAELKIRLQHDGISQAQFFRGIVTGYLMQDGDVLSYVDKLALGDDEIDNIFDILEKENPDL